jgi:hypothetical protein
MLLNAKNRQKLLFAQKVTTSSLSQFDCKFSLKEAHDQGIHALG